MQKEAWPHPPCLLHAHCRDQKPVGQSMAHLCLVHGVFLAFLAKFIWHFVLGAICSPFSAEPLVPRGVQGPQ